MQNDTIPEATQAKPERRSSFIILAGTVFGLTVFADFLLFGHRPGLGLALFLPILWISLAAHRRVGKLEPKDLLLLALLAGATVATAVAPSAANTLIFVTLTFYASGHWVVGRLSPYWARAIHGLHTFTRIPSALENVGRGIDEMFVAAGNGNVQRSAGWLVRICRIVLPVALVCLPFFILLGGGNAILGHAISDSVSWIFGHLLRFEAPSGMRFVFWIAVAMAAFCLLGNRPKTIAHKYMLEEKIKNPPGDLSVAIWRARLLLAAVNVMFFAANATDLVYLWGGVPTLPDGVGHSEFVHAGTNHLIACVVLAAAVLLLLFNGSPKVTHARGLRGLAALWIAQNLLLTSGVVLRLKLYVGSYGLSVTRVHLVLFLILVAVGFVLLLLRIAKGRTLRWLVGGNLAAVFALFFVAQFTDIRGFVARYNVSVAASAPDRAMILDLDYLYELAPESWPALRTVAEYPELFGDRSARAGRWLANAARSEASFAAEEDWRSWTWRKNRLRRTGLQDLAKQFAINEKRDISRNPNLARR